MTTAMSEEWLYRVHPVGWARKFNYGRGLTISLEPAGHILGCRLSPAGSDHRKVVVSGDYATFGQAHRPSRTLAEHFQHADLLISESTYGAANHPTP